MTSGGAVSHAEEATGHYRGVLEGIQLWVALPEVTRHGDGAFEHHVDLPRAEIDGAVATVLVGDVGELVSPARHDTPLVGVELDMHDRTLVPLNPAWEYALVVLEGRIGLDGRPLPPRQARLPWPRSQRTPPGRRGTCARDPAGWGAVRGAHHDVVELRDTEPGGDRHCVCLLGQAGRPLRSGALQPSAHPGEGSLLAAEPGSSLTATPVCGTRRRHPTHHERTST